jgi:DNA-3-methyladenine glycosylase II
LEKEAGTFFGMSKSKGKFNAKAAVRFLCKKDKKLAKIIKLAGPFPVIHDPQRTPFIALVRAVVYQQLTGKAASTILKRVLALFPGKKFPAPEDLIAIPAENLRNAGLSWSKATSIKDIAAKTVEGVIPDSRQIKKLTDEEIMERLCQVRGVGPWTVEMFLMFTLGRTDILPCSDYGVRKGYMIAYGLKEMPSHKELLALGEKWKPYRSVASWYMWRAVDIANERAKKKKK